MKFKLDDNQSEDSEPPKPISSDEEESSIVQRTSTMKNNTHGNDMSRLFAPYRTIGIVTSGRPFSWLQHQTSANSMLCVPIGDRFQLLQCDRLHPVLVSQKVPGTSSSSSSRSKSQHISNIIADATLSITIAAHGPQAAPTHVTLYNRTRPLQNLKLSSSGRSTRIVDMLHLGRLKVPMAGEKEGKLENAVLIAVILSRGGDSRNNRDDDETSILQGKREDDNVAVVGDSDDDDDDSDDDDSSSSETDSDPDDSSDDETTSNCQCQVVILVATRDSMRVHKRINLTKHLKFRPTVALHPSTYVNKIAIGGTHSNQQPAVLLLNIRSDKIIHEFSCLKSNKTNDSDSTIVTSLEQSPAVDTVAVGTNHGQVHLINLRHDKILFSLRHKSRTTESKRVEITSISFRTDGSAMNYNIAPMAVGRSDGIITVWDLNPPDKDDENDNARKGKKRKANQQPRQILTELLQAHLGGVARIMYVPQEPLLISVGTKSNAVIMHIFDSPDHSGRILKQRKGHTSPPTRIQYLHPGAAGGGVLANTADGTDASACQILSSGGLDRSLRVFSTVRTVLDKEYSQGKGLEKKAQKFGMVSSANLKLPPTTSMALSEARTRDWGDLVTIHQDHAFAYVWSTKRGAQWGPVLRQEKWNVSAMKVPPPPSAHATSVAMSACGNYAMVGTKGGIIYKYNVQSGNSRGSYPKNLEEDDDQDRYKPAMQAGDVRRTTKALEKRMKISNRPSNLDKRDQDAVQEAIVERQRLAKLKEACHRGAAVTGMAVDSTNKTMISVGSDAKLILWHFTTHAPHKKSPIKLPSPATILRHIRDSDLAAIALEDYTTLLFDCTTLAIVRRFGGAANNRHAGPICDLGFSPDGRTLYSASLDKTVRVWDVPTNTCVDWLGFESSVTSLAVSPTGEFLATTHMGKLGLSIWSDRSFYQTINVNGTKELTKPFYMDEPKPLAEVWEKTDLLPLSAMASAQNIVTHMGEDSATSDDGDSKLPAVAKQSGLVTLSNLPPAHWKNLFHLELIKERNKPKEPPKKPPTAPFFLQWRGGEPLLDAPIQTKEENDGTKAQENDEDEWQAAWSDDEDEEGSGLPLMDIEESTDPDPFDNGSPNDLKAATTKKRRLKSVNDSRIISSSSQKRTKISHHRSQFATLLLKCSKDSGGSHQQYKDVTDYIASLGPSAIDVAFSSLCSGMHDLEEGLPLLRMACMWLVEVCESRERYEAVNAYLHRFLYLHATVITGVEDNAWEPKNQPDNRNTLNPEESDELKKQDEDRELLLECLSRLRQAQQSATDSLRTQMQSSLCLLRHFSRMV